MQQSQPVHPALCYVLGVLQEMSKFLPSERADSAAEMRKGKLEASLTVTRMSGHTPAEGLGQSSKRKARN